MKEVKNAKKNSSGCGGSTTRNIRKTSVNSGSWRGKMGAGICLLEAGKWDFVHWDWDSWKKNNKKMGMRFQFEQHRLRLWDLRWDQHSTVWINTMVLISKPDKIRIRLDPRDSLNSTRRFRAPNTGQMSTVDERANSAKPKSLLLLMQRKVNFYD